MTCKNTIFPVGGTNSFELICTRYNKLTENYEIQNIKSATEVVVYIVTKNQPFSVLTSYKCSPIYYFADWANGIVTGEFDNSETSKINYLGHANVIVKATIAGEPEYFYSEDRALLLISTPPLD